MDALIQPTLTGMGDRKHRLRRMRVMAAFVGLLLASCVGETEVPLAEARYAALRAAPACRGNELDMLDWMTLDANLRATSRLDGFDIQGNPSHPLYTVVEPDRFWWMKTSEGDTWDINTYDSSYIYWDITEQAFHAPWSCKRAVDRSQWRAARRCVDLRTSSAVIENLQSQFEVLSSAEVQTTSGIHRTRFEVRDAGMMRWRLSPARVRTLVLEYSWDYRDGAYHNVEHYFLTQRHGLVRWQLVTDGVIRVQTTFESATAASAAAPMLSCTAPPSTARRW